MEIKLENNSKPIKNEIEKYIINLLNKKPYECYAEISDTELEMILTKTINKFVNTNINKKIILSIRSSYIKNHMIIKFGNIDKNNKNILFDYNNKINVLQISSKYDVSPLNIIRFVFKNKYSNKLTYLINNKNLIDKYDITQLNIAIDNDVYALIDNSKILTESINFELDIQNKLDKLNIKYKTQNQLSDEQTKLYGMPINTPDFYILSNLYIKNYKINWIDAKNYYGANIPFVFNSIKKQIKKYNKEYGSGCIIFSLGFNNNLHFNNVILLDNNFLFSK